jgi:hypothetical protein
MRLLLVSTPRSGNTWLRHLLADSLDLAHFAVHRPIDLDWHNLPTRAIVQLHWPRTIEMAELIDKHHLFPLVITRHPLDVLISILHFSRFAPETRHWLSGSCGSEDAIRGASPGDASFIRYCLSERAEALLSVSVDWAGRTATPYPVQSVRYESLVASPVPTLNRVLAHIGDNARTDVTTH